VLTLLSPLLDDDGMPTQAKGLWHEGVCFQAWRSPNCGTADIKTQSGRESDAPGMTRTCDLCLRRAFWRKRCQTSLADRSRFRPRISGFLDRHHGWAPRARFPSAWGHAAPRRCRAERAPTWVSSQMFRGLGQQISPRSDDAKTESREILVGDPAGNWGCGT